MCGVKHLSTLSCVTCRHYQRIMLSPWGNYSFRVLAKNKLGTSRPSNPTAQVCSTPPDVPHHNPRQICSENVKPRQLVITWDVRIFFTVLKFFWGGGRVSQILLARCSSTENGWSENAQTVSLLLRSSGKVCGRPSNARVSWKRCVHRA